MTEDEIRKLSHVALLDRFEAQVGVDIPETEVAPIRAEILRRMDSAGTSRRLDIAPGDGES